MTYGNLIAGIISAAVAGVIILAVEYWTGFFANRARGIATGQALDTVEISRLDLNIMRLKWMAGTVFFTALAVTAILSLGYLRSIDDLERQVAAYEQSEDWHLPEAIKNLGDASAELTLSKQERDEFTALQNRVPELESAKSEAETEVEQCREENSELALQIQSLEKQLLPSKRIEIAQGSAEHLIGNSITLGLRSLTDDYVRVTWNNELTNVDIGEALGFTWNGESCVVTLVKIDQAANKAEFTVTCSP